MADSKAANARLHQQLRTLERRLGELIETNADNGASELQTLAALAPPSYADVASTSLPTTIDELRSVMAKRDEELQAARRLNADLTRLLNQSVSIRNLSDPMPS